MINKRELERANFEEYFLQIIIALKLFYNAINSV